MPTVHNPSTPLTVKMKANHPEVGETIDHCISMSSTISVWLYISIRLHVLLPFKTGTVKPRYEDITGKQTEADNQKIIAHIGVTA